MREHDLQPPCRRRFVAIAAGFLYVAVIMDAWSRRVVDYAIGLRIDARLTSAALNAAIEHRRPAAFITPTAAFSMGRRRTATCSHATAWSARWAGGATLMTTRRRRAS